MTQVYMTPEEKGARPDSELDEWELKQRLISRKQYYQRCESKGVEEMRAEWRRNAERSREARRARAREAYAKRRAALKLVEELQLKGLDALL